MTRAAIFAGPSRFPITAAAERVLKRYFLPDGRAPGEPYKLSAMYKQVVVAAREQLTMLANFAEVWLATEGHGVTAWQMLP